MGFLGGLWRAISGEADYDCRRNWERRQYEIEGVGFWINRCLGECRHCADVVGGLPELNIGPPPGPLRTVMRHDPAVKLSFPMGEGVGRGDRPYVPVTLEVGR